jgi:RPA family protein
LARRKRLTEKEDHNNPYKSGGRFLDMNEMTAPITEQRKRNVAYRMRIGDVLKGRPITAEGKFLYLELGERKLVRVNFIANCIDKFMQDGEKKYASITIDDASGQIRLKAFGDDILRLKDIVQGDTLQIIGNVREWNAELYVLPEIVKKVDPRWLLVRKLELQQQKDTIVTDNTSPLRHGLMQRIKDEEINGGVDTDVLIADTQASKDSVMTEVKKLLEEGLIYEPRPGRLRWLG